MSLIVISSERFVEHTTPPGHPESPERAEVMEGVALTWRDGGGEIVAPRPATREQLARVHSPEYLDRMAGTSGVAVALDPDTYTSPETYEVALLSAGAAIDAVERVLNTRGTRALVLSRPPGHHAERDRAMGFCFFNNVAVAAAHARARGIKRMAIVDYDVHHGNGTQHMFEHDADVLYVSMHQYPYYPGTGAASEVGYGDGLGRTVNLPLEVGATDEDYRTVFEQVVAPVLQQFQPELMLLSAGFDAHVRDPLAGMRVTTEGFSAMNALLRSIAEEHCDGRLVAVTEGGYDLRALRECLQATVDLFSESSASPPRWPASGVVSTRGSETVRQAKLHLARHWRGL
jgi:acetoin utilization deacetylase AcuC-like enzyme